MKLFVVSEERPVPGEAARFEELVASGAEALHLRRPHADERELRLTLRQLSAAARAKMVLHANDHCGETAALAVACEFGLAGTHLPERLRRGVLTPGIRSTSFHDLAALTVSARDPLEYVLFGPVFDSISKRGYRSPFDAEQLREAAGSRERVVAVGGVTEARLGELAEFGFWGAAACGAIWREKSPLEAFRRLQSMKEAA